MQLFKNVILLIVVIWKFSPLEWHLCGFLFAFINWEKVIGESYINVYICLCLNEHIVVIYAASSIV